MLKNGHLSDEEIALYADALISKKADEIDAKIKAHILECDECADKVLAVTEIAEDFFKEEQTSDIKTIPLKKSYWLRIAASVILIIGAGLIVFQIKHVNNNKIRVIAETTDSIVTPIDSSSVIKEQKEIIAKTQKDSAKIISPETKEQAVNDNLLAYVENKDLEKLVNRFIEANLRDSFSVYIESLVKININEELVFELNNKNKEIFILEFFNNKGVKLFEEETSENIYKTTQIKSPGLYYWKLLNEDFDLLFCGKIIVK